MRTLIFLSIFAVSVQASAADSCDSAFGESFKKRYASFRRQDCLSRDTCEKDDASKAVTCKGAFEETKQRVALKAAVNEGADSLKGEVTEFTLAPPKTIDTTGACSATAQRVGPLHDSSCVPLARPCENPHAQGFAVSGAKYLEAVKKETGPADQQKLCDYYHEVYAQMGVQGKELAAQNLKLKKGSPTELAEDYGDFDLSAAHGPSKSSNPGGAEGESNGEL